MKCASWNCSNDASENSNFCPTHPADQQSPVPLMIAKPEMVDHPAHYGGADDPYEAIKVIEAWRLNFNLGNCIKYIRRRMAKDPDRVIEELRKSMWYLNREIENLEKAKLDASIVKGGSTRTS